MAKRTAAVDDDDPFSFLDEEEAPKPGKKDRPRKEESRRMPPGTSGGESKPARGMPSEVPVLTADDMCYAGDNGEGKRRSLDWWLYWTFFSCKSNKKGKFADDIASDKLREVLTERYGKKVRCMWTFEEYMGKHKNRTLAWLAACWNEALRRLGYEVPERRCKDPGK